MEKSESKIELTLEAQTDLSFHNYRKQTLKSTSYRKNLKRQSQNLIKTLEKQHVKEPLLEDL